MQTPKKSNGGEALSSMPEEFGGMYQTGYEAGFACGRESGYRQGYEAGFGDGRRQGNNSASPAAVENAHEDVAAMSKSRLFGLPCTKCRRLMYSDETRCAYCKAPRAALVEPPSATCCDPEEVRKREPDGGLESPRISRRL